MLRLLLALVLSTSVGYAGVAAADADNKATKKADKQQALFKKLDANNDGKISLDEFRKVVDFHPKLKEKATALNKRFSKLDTNADGFLSQEEFNAARTKTP
ncbi:MAG: EF-hand domain-containing protein [Gemmatales bacterium]|nr:EF-hand domain-containing protein [Gemmatales bacterium]MCS7160325.1 EF-hand domain-containing protein [Gemmatales bacterium]MDW8175525.1 EF-hand domain-containing protein [Gemmatales bacterium]MDW8222077.1 EF-hand domain-containing protein [Gemmatales bacterium]